MPICEAITWKLEEYIECDGTGPVERVRLEGYLLSVEVELCHAHQKHFAKKEHWMVVDAASGKEVGFQQGKRYIAYGPLDRRSRPEPLPAQGAFRE